MDVLVRELFGARTMLMYRGPSPVVKNSNRSRLAPLLPGRIGPPNVALGRHARIFAHTCLSVIGRSEAKVRMLCLR